MIEIVLKNPTRKSTRAGKSDNNNDYSESLQREY